MSWFLRDYLDDPMFFGRVFDPNDMQALSTGVKAGGQIFGGYNALVTGKAAQANSRVEAAQEIAAGQRRGFERDAQTHKVLGTQQAVAAASGASAASPTILDIMGETAQRGKYLEESENAAAKTKANATLYAGEVAKRAGQNQFTGSILQGVGTGLTGGYKIAKRTDTDAPDDSVTDEDTGETIRARRARLFG